MAVPLRNPNQLDLVIRLFHNHIRDAVAGRVVAIPYDVNELSRTLFSVWQLKKAFESGDKRNIVLAQHDTASRIRGYEFREIGMPAVLDEHPLVKRILQAALTKPLIYSEEQDTQKIKQMYESQEKAVSYLARVRNGIQDTYEHELHALFPVRDIFALDLEKAVKLGFLLSAHIKPAQAIQRVNQKIEEGLVEIDRLKDLFASAKQVVLAQNRRRKELYRNLRTKDMTMDAYVGAVAPDYADMLDALAVRADATRRELFHDAAARQKLHDEAVDTTRVTEDYLEKMAKTLSRASRRTFTEPSGAGSADAPPAVHGLAAYEAAVAAPTSVSHGNYRAAASLAPLASYLDEMLPPPLPGGQRRLRRARK